MGVLYEVEKTVVDHHFPIESDKVCFLEERLCFYDSLGSILPQATKIDYDLRLSTPQGQKLWIGGAHGPAGVSSCHTNGGTIPYVQFLEDLVAMSGMLEVTGSESEVAERFNSKLMDYAINLYKKGFICELPVKVDPSKPDEVRQAIWNMCLTSAARPTEIISTLQKKYVHLVLEGKGLKGKYDSSRIVEEFQMVIVRDERADTAETSSLGQTA